MSHRDSDNANDTQAITLDVTYTFTRREQDSLVVEWFYNNSPFYRWSRDLRNMIEVTSFRWTAGNYPRILKESFRCQFVEKSHFPFLLRKMLTRKNLLG